MPTMHITHLIGVPLWMIHVPKSQCLGLLTVYTGHRSVEIWISVTSFPFVQMIWMVSLVQVG